MDSKMSAHRSVRRRHAKRFVYGITDKRVEKMKREINSHRPVGGYPISGGVSVQRAPALESVRIRENRRLCPKVRGPHHLLYRLLKPQQIQHANTGKLGGKYCRKRGPHTRRVISHLSECSGGMVFFRLGGSFHGRATSSRFPHQLSLGSGV